jgi:hypothetical protein
MKVCAFTFVKNAIKYDYPIVESIRSILPIADEYIICAGDSEDDTEKWIGLIGSGKIKIIHSVWDKNLREEGRVLAVETDKAIDAAPDDADWLFYLQADEVVHEKYLPVIKEAMEKFKDDKRIEGLLFRYIHFYGSYIYVGDGRKWYSKEIRVIRNNKQIRSYRDAQGFRINGRKLRVKQIDAYIYHYGWVRNPVLMQKKWRDFGQFWNKEETHQEWTKKVDESGKEFDYSKIDSLTKFGGSHPAVMLERIKNEDWNFEYNLKNKNFKNFKHRMLYFIQQSFGWRPFEYRKSIYAAL